MVLIGEFYPEKMEGIEMNKGRIVLFMIFTLLLISACSFDKGQSLEAIYTEAGLQQVDQVLIENKEEGTSKEVTDQEAVDEFVASLKEIRFTPEKDSENYKDYQYKMTFIDSENDERFEFQVNKIGDTYYDTSSNVLRIVDQYYLGIAE